MTDTFVSPQTKRITVPELAKDYFGRLEGKHKDTKVPLYRWNRHLAPFFGHYRAANVGMPLLDQYQVQRQQEGAADATIRES
jgi:hypothetical protein